MAKGIKKLLGTNWENWNESKRIRNPSLNIRSEILSRELRKGNKPTLQKLEGHENVISEMIVYEMNKILNLIKV
jgi:hypothetical protein